MLTLILKVSMTWAILLAFYFLLLSKERAARWNRLYLWLGLILGIVIPFTESPFPTQQIAKQATPIAVPRPTADVEAVLNGNTPVAGPGDEMNWLMVLFYVWLAGAALQLFFLVRNAFQLYRLKKRSSPNLHPVANYYTNENISSAFSFGSSIFLPKADHDAKDLSLILQHERGHYRHRHWVDNVILELGQVVFWAHPLFYVFKKQIKLVHEYEVDADIDAADRYDYGRLLLAQNNNTYRSVLVHTFNFSPIKKRIAMMTNSRKANKWKFLWALPLMGICFGLMSAERLTDERIRQGDITKFRGNTIEWKIDPPQEVEYTDGRTGERVKDIRQGEEYIRKVNGNTVALGVKWDMSNGQVSLLSPAIGKVIESIQQAILKNKEKFPSDIALIEIQNLVIDEDLIVYYYDIITSGVRVTDTTLSGKNKFPEIDKNIREILENKELIDPDNIELPDGYYSVMLVAGFSPVSFGVRELTPEERGTIEKERQERIEEFRNKQ